MSETEVTTADTFRIEDGVPMVGERAFAWASKVTVEDAVRPDFSWRRRGFYLTFENGYTLSVQWGCGTYSTNHHAGFSDEAAFTEAAATAEIALWNRDEEWFEWESDTVRGWCSPADVLAVIEAVASWSSDSFGTNPLVDES